MQTGLVESLKFSIGSPINSTWSSTSDVPRVVFHNDINLSSFYVYDNLSSFYAYDYGSATRSVQ
jgi:hypothetical protein